MHKEKYAELYDTNSPYQRNSMEGSIVASTEVIVPDERLQLSRLGEAWQNTKGGGEQVVKIKN